MNSALHAVFLNGKNDQWVSYCQCRRYTLADLRQHVQKLKAYLTACMPVKVILRCNHQYWTLTSLLAAQQAGIPVVLVSDPMIQQIQDGLIISDDERSDCDFLLSYSELNQLADTLPLSSVDTQQSISLLTSGSSGSPSLIEKKLIHFENEIHCLENTFGHYFNHTAVISSVPSHHIYGLIFSVLWPFLTQRLLTDMSEYSSLQGHKILVTTPSYLQRVSFDADNQPTCVFCSGGPLPQAMAKTARQTVTGKLIEVYGSTETGGIAWRDHSVINSDWTTFDDVSYTLDTDSHLVIQSPFIPTGVYRTNDQAESVSSSQFRLTGRADRMVKIAEKRISLDQIEMSLSKIEGVVESAAIVLNSEQLPRIAAALVLNASAQRQYDEAGHYDFWTRIRRQLLTDTEHVALPRKLRIVKEIPVTDRGKRALDQIRALF